jgi:lipopolysaccharide export LptBFGC system permease protein LptF
MKTPIKLFLLIAILAALIFHWPEPHSYIPAKLWGVWKTDQAKYTDRYLDISEAIFSLGQGQQRVQVYFIEQVDIASDGPQERYTIRYRDQEGGRAPLQTFTFFSGRIRRATALF